MATSINNEDQTIDSRDVIARIEELESELEDVNAEFDEDEETEAYGKAVAEWHESDDGKELKALQELASEAKSSFDWEHGQTLIHRDYFINYITELIDDCYEMPKGEGWPYSHLTMDYESAAEEAEHDYMSVDFDGQEYLIGA